MSKDIKIQFFNKINVLRNSVQFTMIFITYFTRHFFKVTFEKMHEGNCPEFPLIFKAVVCLKKIKLC